MDIKPLVLEDGSPGLTPEQLNHISRIGRLMRLLAQEYLDIVLNNDQWNGGANMKGITQEDIDTIPSFDAIDLNYDDINECDYINAQLLNLLTSRIGHVVKMANLP